MTALIALGKRAGLREAFWPANALAALAFGRPPPARGR